MGKKTKWHSRGTKGQGQRILAPREETMHQVKIFKPDSSGALQLVDTLKPEFVMDVKPLRHSYPRKKDLVELSYEMEIGKSSFAGFD